MKHLNNYNTYNENIFHTLGRLGKGDRPNTKDIPLGRAIDDIEAKKIFNDMKKDFEKYNKDLRKVMIIDNYKVNYVYGEYHQIKNSPMTGNYTDDKYKKEIKVSFWKGKGIGLGKGDIEIEETVPNPNYDPTLRLPYNVSPTDEEREKLRSINTNENRFKISYDIAKSIYDYFNEEYIKQYPQLKDAGNKNLHSIQDIEKGNKPTLGWVDLRDPNNTEIIYNYTDVNDKIKLEKYIKNNVCMKGKNKDNEPITYFTKKGESMGEVRDNIMNWSRKEVELQNKERIRNYK